MPTQMFLVLNECSRNHVVGEIVEVFAVFIKTVFGCCYIYSEICINKLLVRCELHCVCVWVFRDPPAPFTDAGFSTWNYLWPIRWILPL